MKPASVSDELERFISAVERSTGLRPKLEPGATDEEIRVTETQLGIKFGAHTVDLYRSSNGGVKDSILSYSPLEYLEEPTQFLRLEMTMGELTSDEQARAIMDTTRLVALVGAFGDYWVVSPEDPDERIYGYYISSGDFGVIGRNWLEFVGMHADLADRGYVVVDRMGARPQVIWRRAGEGPVTAQRADGPEFGARVGAQVSESASAESTR